MKKNKFLLLAIIPLLLTGCKHKGVSFRELLKRVNSIENTGEHPYYKVAGSLDMLGMILEIDPEDALFDQMPTGDSYVANARYNEGFYNEIAETLSMSGVEAYSEEETVIFGMSSRSYWLRMPLRLHKDNFYVKRADGTVNLSCGYSNLQRLICADKGAEGAVNASSNDLYYELLPGGGFAIGGDNVRTKFYLDNYPYYLNYAKHEELGDWDPEYPLPCYSANDFVKGAIDGRFNIRFVYDKNGWLKSEYLATTDYDYKKTTDTQLALKSVYNYKFSD